MASVELRDDEELLQIVVSPEQVKFLPATGKILPVDHQFPPVVPSKTAIHSWGQSVNPPFLGPQDIPQ